MSSFITIEDAQTRLPEVIDKLYRGEELFITRDDKIVARLIGAKQLDGPITLGTLRGTVLYMAPDFDAPLEDFKEYM